MKNSIQLLTAIIVATVLFASCNSRSAEKAEAERIYAQAIADANKLPAIDSATLAQSKPQEYVFHPAEVQVTDPVENKKELRGEGDYTTHVHTFNVQLFFIDSLGKEFSTGIRGEKYLDKGALDGEDDDGSQLKKAKNAYAEITDALPQELTVTISADKKTISIARKEKITERKIGKATVRIAAQPSIWQGDLN